MSTSISLSPFIVELETRRAQIDEVIGKLQEIDNWQRGMSLHGYGRQCVHCHAIFPYAQGGVPKHECRGRPVPAFNLEGGSTDSGIGEDSITVGRG